MKKKNFDVLIIGSGLAGGRFGQGGGSDAAPDEAKRRAVHLPHGHGELRGAGRSRNRRENADQARSRAAAQPVRRRAAQSKDPGHAGEVSE